MEPRHRSRQDGEQEGEAGEEDGFQHWRLGSPADPVGMGLLSPPAPAGHGLDMAGGAGLYAASLCGAIAQLGERLNGIQEVRGSTPLGSTRAAPRLLKNLEKLLRICCSPHSSPRSVLRVLATAGRGGRAANRHPQIVDRVGDGAVGERRLDPGTPRENRWWAAFIHRAVRTRPANRLARVAGVRRAHPIHRPEPARGHCHPPRRYGARSREAAKHADRGGADGVDPGACDAPVRGDRAPVVTGPDHYAQLAASGPTVTAG